VFVGVVLTGFAGMMACVQSVAVRNMRMVCGGFVIARFVMFRGVEVVFRRVFVVFCGGAVMVGAFV
jgi:hypothetical protein